MPEPSLGWLLQGNWLLSGTVAVAIMLSIMIAVFFDKWYGKREKRAMEAMTKMELGSRYQYLSEGGGALSYRDMKELLLYKVSDLIGPTIEEEKEKVRAKAFGLSGLNAAGGVIKGGFSGILYGLSLGAATFWAFLGEISVGFVIQSSRAIYQMAESLTAFFQVYAEMKVDMQRFASTFDYLELGAEGDGGAKKESQASIPKEVQTIEFEKVTFTYPGAGAKAIDCLSLSIQGDKKTALVGRNGSGKQPWILCQNIEFIQIFPALQALRGLYIFPIGLHHASFVMTSLLWKMAVWRNGERIRSWLGRKEDTGRCGEPRLNIIPICDRGSGKGVTSVWLITGPIP